MNQSKIPLNQIAEIHFKWVEKMGWHNRTPLEALALVASEIGEAIHEAMSFSNKLQEELADVLLRCLDIAEDYGVDAEKVTYQVHVEWKGVSLIEKIAELMVDYGHWANSARVESVMNNEEFSRLLGVMIAKVINLSDSLGMNMELALFSKMASNEARGSRGRLK